MEQFFTSVFEHAPVGSFFYAARIIKVTRQAFPKFYDDPSLLEADAKAHKETDLADFYFSPAFYSRKTKAIKSNVKGAGTVWVDCDAGLPEFDQEPNFILETSPGHFHCYWLLGEMRRPDDVEAINRTLAYQYNTDKSGWDSTQLLRPPCSYNRKRDNFRTRIQRADKDSHATFTATPLVHSPEVDRGSMGEGGNSSVEQILATEVFTKSITSLIFTATDTKTGEGRSGVIFNLACSLVKMGMPNVKILTLLLFTDDRLGKYTKHSDRIGTLQGVIASARAKEKVEEPKAKEKKRLFQIYSGNAEFFTHVSDDEFLCDPLVFVEGILMISGEPFAGKSRFAMNLADSLACGQEFLGMKIERAIKCCYLGLNMPIPRVKSIRQQQLSGFGEGQRELINENVKLMLRGSSANFVDPEVQAEVTEDLLEIGAEFIVIDVVGGTMPDMSEDKYVVPFLDWLQGYITDTHASFCLISHTRKSQVGNKSTNKLDDWYGSRHWSITPDTGFIIESKGSGLLTLHVNKDRSGKLDQTLEVRRDSQTSLHAIVTGETPTAEDTKGEDTPGGKM